MNKCLRILSIFIFTFGFTTYTNLYANGNLSVSMFSQGTLTGVGPGDTTMYVITYNWDGDNPANDVSIKAQFPNEVSILSMSPLQGTQVGTEITWDIGTVTNSQYGYLMVSVVISPGVQLGTELVSTATITTSTTEDNLEDNMSSVSLTIQNTDLPDLWVIKLGLLESIESGAFFTAEKGVATTFEVSYFNFSSTTAPDVVLTDILPAGTEFISADPSPSSVNGNEVKWNLNTLGQYGNGKIIINIRPNEVGNFTNTATIASSAGDRNQTNNTASFPYSVAYVLPPHVLKPSITAFSDDTLLTGKNPKFEGLAKAGAQVILYEGDSLGTFGDFSALNAVELARTTVGSDRRWEISPSNMTEDKIYYLYLRTESEGQYSTPFLNWWRPIKLRVNSIFDLAGFDMNNFVVQSGDAVYHPGVLGSTSSSTPDADIRIEKVFKAPEAILTDHSMWANHKMKLVITENGETTEEDLPVYDVQPTGAASTAGLNEPLINLQYRFIYVHKGFGPGAQVEVWCLPEYYDDEGNLVLTGLVWVKCHKILIDPAGYVYDVDLAEGTFEWPNIPPENSLIQNATVTAMVRTGDESWERWNAEETGQVNPQITDSTDADRINIKGYYAFYVPSGQYQVKATAPGYADYTSPILTVVDEPIFHNVGMQKIAGQSTSVFPEKFSKDKPSLFVLEQNYPNPFNPITTIGYYVPVAGPVTLKIFDIQGKEVGTLINNEFKQPGKYLIQFDGSSLSSGIYFYNMKTANFTSTKKFVLMK